MATDSSDGRVCTFAQRFFFQVVFLKSVTTGWSVTFSCILVSGLATYRSVCRIALLKNAFEVMPREKHRSPMLGAEKSPRICCPPLRSCGVTQCTNKGENVSFGLRTTLPSEIENRTAEATRNNPTVRMWLTLGKPRPSGTFPPVATLGG